MIGKTLKHYRIEAQLGRGGMGIVYRARDTRLDRPVALKMLPPGLVADPERKARLLLEARSAAAVVHPAIAQVYDIDEVDGEMFMAMEYVDGRTAGRLAAEKEIDLLGAVEIVQQVAEGLAKAHDAGILHRDIKSDNIMVTRDGHAKLLDFGLAKLLEPGPPGSLAGPFSRTVTQTPSLTVPGAVMGTISYFSPEQARGKELDRRSDIFSLGVVLYELATSELPFKGETPLDTMHAIAYEEARPVTSVRVDLPDELQRIIARCLRKRPEERYPDAHALAADLKKLKQSLETGARPALGAGARARRFLEGFAASFPGGAKGLAIVAGAVLLTVILILVRFDYGALIGPAILALFLYRFIRNRKKRLLNALVKKAAKMPEVRLIRFAEDRLTIALDKAPAKVYIRLTALIDELNKKLVFGRPVQAEVKTDLADEELEALLRQVGVVYAREGAPGAPSRS